MIARPHSGAPAGDAASVRAAADGLQATLATARALVAIGRQIDLHGLEKDAAALCLAVQLLPPEGGAALRPALQALLAEVQLLTHALETPP